MRVRVVAHYLGLLVIILGLLMILPLAWSYYHQGPDFLPFAISACITMVAGLVLWRLMPGGAGNLTRREGLALVTWAWILASLFGALPYQLAGTFPSYLDAYFEAMSGFTTTGATVLTSIESQPQGILLWRNFTQWLGGMGIVTLFVALFPMLGLGAAHLYEAEMPGPQPERLAGRIRDTARSLWGLYIGLSALETLLLRIGGRIPLFDALTITFGTMPTGGFLPHTLSIGTYNNSVFITSTVTLFMVMAGANFGLYYYFLGKHQPRRLFGNPEFQLYIAILIGASLIIMLDLVGNMGQPVGEAFRYATFQTVSIQTTTGFATANFDAWPSLSRSILLILMIVGASAGSTGGALKVVRILVLAKCAFRQIFLAFSPRSVLPLKLGGNVLPESVVSGIVGTSILYFATLIIAFLAMSAMGLDIITAFSSVAATLGNVGPGLGGVGPAGNYFLLPFPGKIVLILCMLVGRLEFFTVLVLVIPAFWRWR
ncbi:MAG TPA: TrkH family potassium uptake protein [Dehalococcoidia bacterium]|nr:TrkH family potassium uptake protein [Dehalococcoidia bacterium]